MPSTYSPSLRLELIGAGEQSGTWGTTTNTNLGTLLEQSIAGVQAITMVDANYTLSNYNGVSDEARRAVLVVSGTNAAIRDVIAPLVTKAYTIKNNTTGGFAINIRAPSGLSVSIPNGGTTAVYCDGTDFVAATYTIAAGVGISITTVGSTTTITNTNNFVSGTRLPFFNATAPTGWTQVTTYTNHMLRVVGTAGGATGGTDNPVFNNTSVPAHTHIFTGTAHTHTDSGHVHNNGMTTGLGFAGGANTLYFPGTGVTNTGLGNANISTVTAGGTNANNTAVGWSPQYVDMIICNKN